MTGGFMEVGAIPDGAVFSEGDVVSGTLWSLTFGFFF